MNILNRKNKSFRPRERPKKGLKNLQSVKTLTAGQNLINNQTSVKTRKQPLTVTAQFQNSLIALMETLNQVRDVFKFHASTFRSSFVSFTGKSLLHPMHQIESEQDSESVRWCDSHETGKRQKTICFYETLNPTMRESKTLAVFTIIIIILGSERGASEGKRKKCVRVRKKMKFLEKVLERWERWSLEWSH